MKINFQNVFTVRLVNKSVIMSLQGRSHYARIWTYPYGHKNIHVDTCVHRNGTRWKLLTSTSLCSTHRELPLKMPPHLKCVTTAPCEICGTFLTDSGPLFCATLCKTQQTVRRPTEMKDEPASAHDVTDLFIRFNLIRRQTDLTTAWDTFTFGNVRRHRCTLTRQQGLAETDTQTHQNYVRNTITRTTTQLQVQHCAYFFMLWNIVGLARIMQ